MDETKGSALPVKRMAVIAYHSSPLHEPGQGDAGGMTVYVRGLARALAQRGVHTDIFTRASSAGDRTSFIADGVRVVPIEAGPRGLVPKEDLPNFIDDFVTGIRAFVTMQRLGYDVIHSHYWQSGLTAKVLAESWGVPLVHSHHTLGRVKNATLPPGDEPEPPSRLEGEQQVIAAADVLIASTAEEYHSLACMYKAPHDCLKILSPGVDHEIFKPGDRDAARKALGLDPDRAVLLFVGRIQKLKGVELAIRSLGCLAGDLASRDPLLLIVGGPSGAGGADELARLHALTQELGLTERVRFEGPQLHTALPEYYAAADVVLVCSHSESFALAPLEAHASARPVVGTPVGGLSHIVNSGVSGYLIDDRDPKLFAVRLVELLSDEARLDSFSKAAFRASLPFSWDNTADSFLELYECLVNERFPELCTC